MLHRPAALRLSRAFVATLVLSVAACTDAPTSLVPSTADVSAPAASAAGGAPKFWETGSSVAWNRYARGVLSSTPQAGNVVVQARLFTYLSIAQYNAVVAAENGGERGVHPSPAAAAAAASARVLTGFFPALSGAISAHLAEQLAGEMWPGEATRDRDAGIAIGNVVASAVLAYAATDHVGLTPAPAVPVGPGKWTSTNSVTTLYGARWFVLSSGDDVMPPEPPAFGSMRFTAELAEIHDLALGRKPEQTALALYWAPRNGAAMNDVATDLIVRFHRTEREAARILALTNIASFDAINACFVAKFRYYYIRPTQADPSIALIPGLGLPNHPSYPSGHSCIVGSMTGVLAAEFPSQRGELDAMMADAGFSRMIAGFHFRFDVEAGQALGRAVARAVVQSAPAPRAPIALD